jgi:hypothetical protein
MLCARYGHRVRIEEVDDLCARLVEIGREHSQPIRLGGEPRRARGGPSLGTA